jgi:hypothetical protein
LGQDEDPFSLRFSRSLLTIFWTGEADSLVEELQPTFSTSGAFDALSSPYSEWLTHNAGAHFSTTGIDPALKTHTWNHEKALAHFVGKSKNIKDALEVYYNAKVKGGVESYFASLPVGTVAEFPRHDPFYTVLLPSESPSWVGGATVNFNNGGWPKDDLGNAIGRGRVLSLRARYTVEKKSLSGVEYLKVTQVSYDGEVRDLYDFNQEATSLASAAATVQLGFGNGSYGRTNGRIFLIKIEFQETLDNPF